MADTAYFVHPSSFVDDGAQIGDGTKIWHFSHVMPKAKVGKNCVFGQNVYIGNVVIGNGVKVQNNVSLYDGVTLEDFVFCGPSAVFTNVINPRSDIERKTEYKLTLVKKGATIGANATIICGATLGEYCFVAAGAVVRGDVPPFGLVGGVPAKLIGWMCRCAVRLPADAKLQTGGRWTCSSCNTTFKESQGSLKLVPPTSS